MSEDADRSRVGARETDDRVDRGRLSGAVRSQKTEKLAGFDAKRDFVDGGEVAVTFYEILDFDGWCYGTNPLRRL
jgi:hypothetical protein